jgi:hypothetical protein
MDLSCLHAKPERVCCLLVLHSITSTPLTVRPLCRKRRGVLLCHHPRVVNPLPHQELRAVYQLRPSQLMPHLPRQPAEQRPPQGLNLQTEEAELGAPRCWWRGVRSLDQRRLRCSSAQRAGFSTRLYSLLSRARSGCLPLYSGVHSSHVSFASVLPFPLTVRPCAVPLPV